MHTFPLGAELVVVLPKLGGQLGALHLDLRVRWQEVRWGSLSDHRVGLDVQVPVHSAHRHHTDQIPCCSHFIRTRVTDQTTLFTSCQNGT